MPRTWTAAPTNAGWCCGCCGATIVDHQAVQLIALAGIDRRPRVRCIGCAVGEPDLAAIHAARERAEAEDQRAEERAVLADAPPPQRYRPTGRVKAFESIGNLLDQKAAAAGDRE